MKKTNSTLIFLLGLTQLKAQVLNSKYFTTDSSCGNYGINYGYQNKTTN